MLTYWLVWRDLAISTRRRAVWVVMAVQTLVLAAVLTIWGDGIPVLTGPVLEQFARVHLAFALPVLPWLAARCSGDRRELSLLLAVTAASPVTVAAARSVALMLLMISVLVTTLPLYVVVFRMTNGVSVEAALVMATLLALMMFASVFVPLALVSGHIRLRAWIENTLLAAAVITLAPLHAVVPILLLLAAIGGVACSFAVSRQLGGIPLTLRGDAV